MPGQDGEELPELLRFGSHDGLGEHARLVSGRWPRTGGPVVEAAISRSAAVATGFGTGREFVTKGRLDRRPVTVRVVGVFQLDDPMGERWAGEDLLSRGAERGEYTTYGPLMVPRRRSSRASPPASEPSGPPSRTSPRWPPNGCARWRRRSARRANG
ncbi:hypothetical protein ACFQYP_57430 [Nonomuraea antimicrobica]